MSLEITAKRLALVTNTVVNDYSTYDFGREKEYKAKSFTVEKKTARDTLLKIRKELESGLIAFIGTTQNLALKEYNKAEIVIAEGTSQFDILEIARSGAPNYDLLTEDIISKLKEYDSNFGINIFHAESDTIAFILKNFPKNLTQFCWDIYEFCPDIVNQGSGSIEKLEEGIDITGEVYLWWD